MTQYIVKIVLSALIVVAVSETAKRTTFWGGVLASLPLTSLLAIIWIWRETKDTAKVTEFSTGVFWLVLPSLALFIVLPTLLERGVDFWLSLGIAIAATGICYLVMVSMLRRFGVTGIG